MQAETYKPPTLFKNGHFNTVVTNLWRSWSLPVSYQRIRIDTFDEDFLDLDFSCVGSQKVMLLVHGLEGNAYSPYMKGMVRAVNQAGWDAVSLNLRGCSGEINKKPPTYHSGKTEDLDVAIQYLRNHFNYEKMALTGFSLGGNLILKYAGEHQELNSNIEALIAISVPFNLESVALNMDKPGNWFYQSRFLKTLKGNALRKIAQYPDLPVCRQEVFKARNFYQFDNAFTAPVNGFDNAETYWRKSSCQNFLKDITHPTLMINALDDPFIPESCIPFRDIEKNRSLELNAPRYGGHVGFGNYGISGLLWHEIQVLQFIRSIGFYPDNSIGNY